MVGPGRQRPAAGRAGDQLGGAAGRGRDRRVRAADHAGQRRGQGADRGGGMTRLGVWYDFRNPARVAAALAPAVPGDCWTRPPTPKSSASTRSGCPSITSPTRATCRRCRPCWARWPSGPRGSGSAPRCCWRRCITRCGWPRTWRWSTSCPAAGSMSGWRPGYRPKEFAVLGVPKRERGARTDETHRAAAAGLDGRAVLLRGRALPVRRRRRRAAAGAAAGAADLDRRQQPGRGPPGGPVRRRFMPDSGAGPGGLRRLIGRTGRAGRPGWRPTGCCSPPRAPSRPGNCAASTSCTSSTGTGSGSPRPATTTRTATS